jgi:ABC-type nitrate/sulfonate/bicarbonate transport system ATPase subunit
MLDIDIREKRFPGRTPGNDHVALRDLRFSVAEGEFVCLVGPSGCGKSTLLNIVNGLDRSVDGRVRLRDAEAVKRIGAMFQNPRLMPWLTVLDNVRLVLEPGDDRRAHELLEAVGLGEVLHAYPNRLSGGMQRRVALARAFAIRPCLLLLDEPFVSLDAPVAGRLRLLLLEQWRQHVSTVLFVTHDLREALQLADRILFLSSSPGRLVLDYPVPLPRSERQTEEVIAGLRDRLLTTHPDLLAGLPVTDEEDGFGYDSQCGPVRHDASPART